MHNALDKYLQLLAHELRALPQPQREQNLREIRAHIEAIIARLVEGGASTEEATEAAIAQFGSARKVGRQLLRASFKPESLGRIVAAPLCGFVGQMVLIGVMLGGLYLVDRHLGLGSDRRFQGYKNYPLLDVVVTVLLQLTPAAGGVLAGRIAPRSALWSAPLLCVVLGVASSTAFPFEVTPLSLFKSTLPVLLGAYIGSRLASRQAERA